MGLTGKLGRSVFSKSRSMGSHDSNVKNNSAMERKRWSSSVRSYLCGDELINSVVAEEDSASVRSSEVTITQGSSEATVTQPLTEELTNKEEIQSNVESRTEEKQNSTASLFIRDDAAIVIQSAFRLFLANREKKNEEKEVKSPSRGSMGTSIEVQTGNSVEVLTIHEENSALPHRVHQRSRSQVLKLKEDWDDSTVSSNISKMRIQNRLEATTRRERALAYAFSQQLRICPKKKQGQSDIGWSWLERWMATRVPPEGEGGTSCIEDCMSKQFEPPPQPITLISQRSVVRRRLFDGSPLKEEKESCGSNDVSLHFQTDCISVSPPEDDDEAEEEEHLHWHGNGNKNRLKPTRSVSRRKTVPSYHYSKDNIKVLKKEGVKQKQSGNKKEIKSKDNTSDVPPQ